MANLSSYERVQRTLERKGVDYCPALISPWPETIEKWIAQGHFPDDDRPVGQRLALHFDLDILSGNGWMKTIADLDFIEQTIEETEDTILKRDGNGAVLRRHRKHAGAPEHVDFDVKDRTGWDEKIKPHLLNLDPRRVSVDGWKAARAFADEYELFLPWSNHLMFEMMHPVCGHENMLMGMALDPDWVCDMVNTYAEFLIMHMDYAFAKGGLPDGFFFFEDMGFKGKPFMSPTMYRDIVQGGHKRVFDYCHSLGKKVIVHSCGYVEPLLPGLIEAGMDCLQAMEVKAGMDLRVLFEKFGDRIAFFGNIDARILERNDLAELDVEMQRKIQPLIRGGGGYIVHSDHSMSPMVEYATAKHFVDYGKMLTRRN